MNIKLQNLNIKKMSAPSKKHQKFTQHEIILKFLADNPNEWYFSWQIPHNTKYGWLGEQKRRRIQELASEGKILVDSAGGYAVYSHK